jgi:predicted TPR repeat methyltransferase
VGWNSAHGQTARFLQLVKLDGLESGARILDLGCGLGDFKAFLDRMGLDVEYTGWDICEPLIEHARELHPNTTFEVRDILASSTDETFDYVVASGLFGLRLEDQHEWMRGMLRTMFSLCERGMAFDMHSVRHPDTFPFLLDPDVYFYARPDEILGHCLELSMQVAVDHTELASAFTVYVYRSNARPIERFREHLRLGTSYTPEHEAVVDYYSRFRMHEELISYLETLEPSAEVFDHIGFAAFQLGDDDRQIAAWNRAVELAPGSARMLVRLATAYMDAGRPAAAIPLLERAAERTPNDVAIAERLAACRQALDG